MKMNYIITGGSGFLGSEICKLLHKKKIDFINIDTNKPLNLIEHYKKADLNNIDSYKDLIKKNCIVIHCAASVPLKKGRFKEDNFDTTKNLAEICLSKEVKKFIYISSSAICGIPLKNPIKENDVNMPIDPYGLSKKKSEEFCESLISKGLPLTIIRPRTIMGIGRLGLFSILFNWIINNRNIPVFNSGSNYYQFIDYEDCVDCIYLASKSSLNDTFNIGAKDFCSIRETIEALIKYSNSNSKIKNIKFGIVIKITDFLSKCKLLPFQEYQIKAYGSSIYFDNCKAKLLLNWQPKFSNKETVMKSFKYFIENSDKEIISNKSIQSSYIKNKFLTFLNLIFL